MVSFGGAVSPGGVCAYTPTLTRVCVLTEPRERCQIPCSVIVRLNPWRRALLQNPELEWQPASPGDFLSAQQHWGYRGECIHGDFLHGGWELEFKSSCL